MFANPSELVLVVNSDNLIEGDGYKDSIIEAKEYAKEGYLAVLGIKPESQSSTYGYILRDKENVKKFIARIDFDEDETEGALAALNTPQPKLIHLLTVPSSRQAP